MSVSKSGRGFGHVSADEHQSEQWSMQLVRHRMKPRGAGIVQSTAGALLVVVQGRLRTLRRNTRNVWVCASQRDALGVDGFRSWGTRNYFKIALGGGRKKRHSLL
jgi:hypothetical protein